MKMPFLSLCFLIIFSTVNLLAQPINYTIEPLGYLANDDKSMANDINDFGEVVGVSFTDWGIYHAVTFQSRKTGIHNPIFLGDLGGEFSFASGINNNFQIVGFAFTSNATEVLSMLWNAKGDTLNVIGASKQLFGENMAWRISDTGHIAGWGRTERYQNRDWPIIYIKGKGLTFYDFEDYKWFNGEAWDINNQGVGCGRMARQLPSGKDRAVLLKDKNIIEITIPNLNYDYTSMCRAINNKNEAVGWATNNDPTPRFSAFVYSYATNTFTDIGFLHPQTDLWSEALDINDAGIVVGSNRSPAPGNTIPGTVDPGQVGFIYYNGIMYDLNDLAVKEISPGVYEPENRYTIIKASAINNSGEIAATIRFNRNPSKVEAAILRPVR